MDSRKEDIPWVGAQVQSKDKSLEPDEAAFGARQEKALEAIDQMEGIALDREGAWAVRRTYLDPVLWRIHPQPQRRLMRSLCRFMCKNLCLLGVGREESGFKPDIWASWSPISASEAPKRRREG